MHGRRYDRAVKGGMAIVLIEWSIKSDDDSVSDFMKWWREGTDLRRGKEAELVRESSNES